MSESIKQRVNSWSLSAGEELSYQLMLQSIQTDLTYLRDRLVNQNVSTGGLAIKSGGSALVKAATAFYSIAGGLAVAKTANTDMAALSGSVTTALFNVYVFYVSSAGTLTSAMGTEGATLAAVVFPTPPVNVATIGFVIINPTGTGSFVGGTTALDDGTVIPGALYVNITGPFDVITALNTLA